MTPEIDEAVRRMARARHEAIERACEEALQGGVCGVLVVNLLGGAVDAAPSMAVPYGEIYEIPAM
jgi:hypothetical protein